MAERKNNKEINTKKKKKETSYKDEIKKLGIIVGVIVLIIVIVYLIVGIFITKDIKLFNDNKDNITETIQYKKILAGETFKKNEDEYYVIFADSIGNHYTLYETIIDNNSDKKIYIVDTSNPLNTSYISEETNKDVQQIKDLKVKSDTLIKIQNQKNVLYVEGKTEIINQFK